MPDQNNARIYLTEPGELGIIKAANEQTKMITSKPEVLYNSGPLLYLFPD